MVLWCCMPGLHSLRWLWKLFYIFLIEFRNLHVDLDVVFVLFLWILVGEWTQTSQPHKERGSIMESNIFRCLIQWSLRLHEKLLLPHLSGDQLLCYVTCRGMCGLFVWSKLWTKLNLGWNVENIELVVFIKKDHQICFYVTFTEKCWGCHLR